MTARSYSPAILAAEQRIVEAREDLRLCIERGGRDCRDAFEDALATALRDLDALTLAEAHHAGRRYIAPEAKRRTFAISLTPAERGELESAADADLAPLAVYIRTAALAAARGRR